MVVSNGSPMATRGTAARRLLACGVAAVVVVGVWAVALVGQAAAALPSNCVFSGNNVTCTYSYTGAAQTFTVPHGVSSVVVDARGAAGGESGFSVGAGTFEFPHAVGGLGARVQGAVDGLTDGELLQVNVGGRGGGDGRETGGFNGGGNGGCNCSTNSPLSAIAPAIAGGGGGPPISVAAATR
jgi:hypothetical protein